MVKMSNVWDRTAEFLSDNIGMIVPIALLAFFVPASISGSFQGLIVTATPGVALALRLVQLAFAVLSVWGLLVISAMALDGITSQTAGGIARRRLLPALLVSLVLGLAMIALTVPLPLYLAASGVDLMAIAREEAPALTPGAAGFVLLYLLVLAILLMWISARLILTTPIIVRERRMLGAIPRSWRMTRGSSWRIIGVLILFIIVASVAGLAARTVFGSVFALVAGGGEGALSLANVLTSIAGAAVQTAFTVIYPAFVAKLYLALAAQESLSQHVPTP